MDNDPAMVSKIDQFLAFCLDFQRGLRGYKATLIDSGWSEPEAWALALRTEERVIAYVMEEILGYAVDLPPEER